MVVVFGEVDEGMGLVRAIALPDSGGCAGNRIGVSELQLVEIVS